MLINKNQPKQTTEKEQILAINTLAFNNLKTSFERVFNIINNGGSAGLIKQEKDVQAILDQFGTEAVSLFQGAGATIAFLQTIDPTYVPPTTDNQYEFNNDGTVTWIKAATLEE